MERLNCWEFKKCGREPGGPKTSEFGTCPAASTTALNGSNSGRNGGRACWAIAGTFCGGVVQGTFASKMSNCLACPFYQNVVREEGPAMMSTRQILARAGGRA